MCVTACVCSGCNVHSSATAQATGVRSGNTAFKSAKLILDARDAKAPSGKLTLDAQGLELAGFSFDRTRVTLDGSESAHRLQLDADGEALKVAFKASGATDRRSWNGLIESLRLEAPKVPPLSLEKPALLAVSANSMSLETACLRGSDSTLCLAGTRTRQEFAVNYSMGMKKKLGLACALIHDPEVLILDEPINGLDPRAARDVQDRLRQAAASGKTIFMSTHLLDMAEKVCTRVGIIHRGELVATGSLEELRARVDENASLEKVFLSVTEETAAQVPTP